MSFWVLSQHFHALTLLLAALRDSVSLECGISSRPGPTHVMSCVTAISHQKMNTVTTGGTNLIFFCFFFSFKKGVKSMTILRLIFIKRIIFIKLYLLIFDTKMAIFLRKVRHVSNSRNVWICLASKNLHIDIFDQNLKKVWIFCVKQKYLFLSEGLAVWRLSRNQFKPVWEETVQYYPARKLELLSPQNRYISHQCGI